MLLIVLIKLIVIIKFKVQISKFKVIVIIKFKVQSYKFKVNQLFSLPNLVIAMLLMLLISALLELLRMLSQWQPARTSQPSTSSAMRLA